MAGKEGNGELKKEDIPPPKTAVKELIRQLLTLSTEEKALITEALQPSVRPKTETVKEEPLPMPNNNVPPTAPSTAIQLPRLAVFSGDGKDVSYEHWRFEVRGLQRDAVYSDAIILQAIRRSLRGKAADVILHLGEDVQITQILGKLDQIFGNVLPSENILEKFYIARQSQGGCCFMGMQT